MKNIFQLDFYFSVLKIWHLRSCNQFPMVAAADGSTNCNTMESDAVERLVGGLFFLFLARRCCSLRRDGILVRLRNGLSGRANYAVSTSTAYVTWIRWVRRMGYVCLSVVLGWLIIWPFDGPDMCSKMHHLHIECTMRKFVGCIYIWNCPMRCGRIAIDIVPFNMVVDCSNT